MEIQQFSDLIRKERPNLSGRLTQNGIIDMLKDLVGMTDIAIVAELDRLENLFNKINKHKHLSDFTPEDNLDKTKRTNYYNEVDEIRSLKKAIHPGVRARLAVNG